ncbi:MAG: acylneuraminate cytidylyltransferase [Clostridia bacterium]|nr:acylneuraminate cytidylyltransferase [Clostridia bacterium]
MKTLIVIPARGGSKRIPRKNVRLMCGRPLICYAIENARGLQDKLDLDIAVSTDDEELGGIVAKMGVTVIARPKELATDRVTLDPVINHALLYMEAQKQVRYDIVITMQATSPTLKAETLEKAILFFEQSEFDTILSATNQPHLSWKEVDGVITKNYEKRLNSQELPKNYVETGGFFITKRSCVSDAGRIGERVNIFEIPSDESVDIDTEADWIVAESILKRKKILFRTVGKQKLGMGHIYRCLTFAYKLTGHQFLFVLDDQSDMGIQKIKESYFPYKVVKDDQEFEALLADYQPDIVVNDILNTTEDYMKMVTRYAERVVNFEDIGPGAKYADAVINALYEKGEKLHNEYYGSKYFCIRDEFLEEIPKEFSESVQKIMIIFGGADPSDLTGRLYKISKELHQAYPSIEFHFILGFAYANKELIQDDSKNQIYVHTDVKRVSAYMNKMDLAITSQGRTVYELASMGVPSIVLAQNKREAEHVFAGIQNGFINLGIGVEQDDATVIQTVKWLIDTPKVRKEMRKLQLAKEFHKGQQRVIKLILGEIESNQ